MTLPDFWSFIGINVSQMNLGVKSELRIYVSFKILVSSTNSYCFFSPFESIFLKVTLRNSSYLGFMFLWLNVGQFLGFQYARIGYETSTGEYGSFLS